MNQAREQRCSVKLVGRHCAHDLCVPIDRPVPPELCCSDDEPAGYGPRGGVICGCSLPEDVAELVCRELRDRAEDCRRMGFVLLYAA